MVNHGKPSPGCQACRRAKKKCTLELPACARCVKLAVPCTDYRDVGALRINDQTELMSARVRKRKAGNAIQPDREAASLSRPFVPPQPLLRPSYSYHDPEGSAFQNHGVQSTEQFRSTGPESPAFNESIATRTADPTEPPAHLHPRRDLSWSTLGGPHLSIPAAITHEPDEVAFQYFLSRFTSDKHLQFVPQSIIHPVPDPCLVLAAKACGTAALSNVHNVAHGAERSRKLYAQALNMVNDALRDPVRSRSDHTLIAVTILSFFENVACESGQSVQAWRAHVDGAAQLLRLRGVAQFETPVGRSLFRETRSQIVTHCLWAHQTPPDFCVEWARDLEAWTTKDELVRPGDALTRICIDFATLLHAFDVRQISKDQAMAMVNDLDARLEQWAIDTPNSDERWRFDLVHTAHSPEAWNKMVHAYSCTSVTGVWNKYRSIRLMVIRKRENLSYLLQLSSDERRAQQSQLQAVRRQLTDDICASVSAQLGMPLSDGVLMTAYNAIWPLFFAGQCAIQCVNHISRQQYEGTRFPQPEACNPAFNSAVAQMEWIFRQFHFIAHTTGLHWATSISSLLRVGHGTPD